MTTIIDGTAGITFPNASVQLVAALPASVIRSARTANTILAAADNSTLIDITSGTFSQTFTAAATLGSGWFVYLRNSGTGDITLDPNASETIDGLTSYIMYGGETRLVQCTGTAFISVVLSPFYRAFTATGTFTKPPGYSYFGGLAWSGGSSGQRQTNTAANAVGGGGGGCFDFLMLASTFGATETISIGAGGIGVTGVANGNLGGNTTIGSLLTVFGAVTFPEGGSVRSGAKASNIFGGVGYESGNSDDPTGISTVWGGATAISSADSGTSVFGGGAGGSLNAATVRIPGVSQLGGNGGAASSASSGTAGTAPAGGGGGTHTGASSGAGARGEVRIWGMA